MWFIPLVRAMHKGNKSHNPSLQADNPYTVQGRNHNVLFPCEIQYEWTAEIK